jgi:hypothetical protein
MSGFEDLSQASKFGNRLLTLKVAIFTRLPLVDGS